MYPENTEDFIEKLFNDWTDAEYNRRQAEGKAILTNDDFMNYIRKVQNSNNAYLTFIIAKYINSLHTEDDK